MICKLRKIYREKKASIEQRLRDFRRLGGSGNNEEIFAELCFCILTPQSRAVFCDKAIKELQKSGLLLKGNKTSIRNKLKAVRFPNNKAHYLVEARRALSKNSRLDVKKRIDKSNVQKTRDWLVRNIKGIGYKEASHFLRNIGLGKDIAILDVHILKNLMRFNIIDKPPKSLSRAKYLEVEDRLRSFSQEAGIPMDHLDLLLWSNETGVIFR